MTLNELKVYINNIDVIPAEIRLFIMRIISKQIPKMPEMIKPHIGKCECGAMIEKNQIQKGNAVL